MNVAETLYVTEDARRSYVWLGGCIVRTGVDVLCTF